MIVFYEPCRYFTAGLFVYRLSSLITSGYHCSMRPEYLISNETAYLNVIPHIRPLAEQGGVYIGVGPDQNYTYIAAVRPSFSFIVDYRRENQLLHFLLKALFEMAGTRQEYLSLLFSKPMDQNLLDRSPSLDYLADYFSRVEGNERFYKKNLSRVLSCLQRYRRTFPADDLRMIEAMYEQFYLKHLDLRFRSDLITWQGWPYPAYRDFLLATDQEGRNRNFLNDDEAFTFVKGRHRGNLIVPIPGDFTGKKTLAALASFIRERNSVVSAFYLSNVEYLLIAQNQFDAFVANVRLLPIDDRSLLIRAFVNTPSEMHPESREGHILTPVVQPIRSFLRLYDEGKYQSYWDVGTLDYIR